MSEQFQCHECSHLGVSGTTKIFTRQNPDGKWEARMGIALIGSTNMDFAGYEAAEHNPFHEKFYDKPTTNKNHMTKVKILGQRNHVTKACCLDGRMIYLKGHRGQPGHWFEAYRNELVQRGDLKYSELKARFHSTEKLAIKL